MLWSNFPGLTMFEFINQYHFFFSQNNLFSVFTPVAKLNFKDSLCFGVKERPKITYQPYPGIYIICTSVTAVFYQLALKIQSPVREVYLHS